MDGDKTTQAERSEPDPGHVFLAAGLRRIAIQAITDYRRLLVSRPGVLLCIRIFLAAVFSIG